MCTINSLTVNLFTIETKTLICRGSAIFLTMWSKLATLKIFIVYIFTIIRNVFFRYFAQYSTLLTIYVKRKNHTAITVIFWLFKKRMAWKLLMTTKMIDLLLASSMLFDSRWKINLLLTYFRGITIQFLPMGALTQAF